MVRTAGDPLAVLPAIRQGVRAADPDQPVAHVRTLDQIVADSITDRRAPRSCSAASRSWPCSWPGSEPTA